MIYLIIIYLVGCVAAYIYIMRDLKKIDKITREDVGFSLSASLFSWIYILAIVGGNSLDWIIDKFEDYQVKVWNGEEDCIEK